jgi:acylphosphatase
MHKRAHVHYSGRVQGVGFRYTAASVARSYDVSGFVKNLVDGRVEIVVEGDEPEVEGFLDELSDRMDGYIRNKELSSKDASGDFRTFTVEY